MPRPTTTLLAVASLAAVPFLAGCGSSKGDNADAAKPLTTTPATTAAAAPTGGPIAVKLDEWRIAPSASTAKAGKVTFDVTNSGKAPHEFVVIRTDKADGALGTGARVPEKGNVGEVGDLKPGGTGHVTLDLKAGSYQLICNLPGHYASGMHTAFRVS